MPERYFDVGIAEQQALLFAAGLALQGARPVAAIYSTFLQRAYDQIVHDVCLQQLPVVLAMDRAGLVGDDGPTHHGVFDIAYLRCLPNITLMAPRDEALLVHMLHTALRHDGGPVGIRYPRGEAVGVPLPVRARAARDRHRRDPARGRAGRDRRLRQRRRQGARRRRPAGRGRARRDGRRRALRQAARHRAARPARRGARAARHGRGGRAARAASAPASGRRSPTAAWPRASCASGCPTATSRTARRSCCTPRSATPRSGSPSGSRPRCSIRAAASPRTRPRPASARDVAVTVLRTLGSVCAPWPCTARLPPRRARAVPVALARRGRGDRRRRAPRRRAAPGGEARAARRRGRASSTSPRRRSSSRAAGSSSPTRSTRSASRSRAAARSTSAPPPAASPTACCSAGRRMSSRSTSPTASWPSRCATTRA